MMTQVSCSCSCNFPSDLIPDYYNIQQRSIKCKLTTHREKILRVHIFLLKIAAILLNKWDCFAQVTSKIKGEGYHNSSLTVFFPLEMTPPMILLLWVGVLKNNNNNNESNKPPLYNVIGKNSLCVDKLLFWLLLLPSFFWVSFWKIWEMLQTWQNS